MSIPYALFDLVQLMMTADETDRLQALRAEGSSYEQLRVSPRKGSTLLVRVAPSRVLGQSGQG